MTIVTARLVLTGTNPMLMHNNNIYWRDVVRAYQARPKVGAEDKKKKGTNDPKGDDRNPAFTWLGYLYHNGKLIGVPSDNLMAMFRCAGTMLPTGNKTESFKRKTQTGILVMDPLYPLTTAEGNQIPWEPFKALSEETNYEKHVEEAAKYNFALWPKPVKVGKSSHIRVRPIFDVGWKAEGRIAIRDDMVSREVFETILSIAGTYCGLSDWRPNCDKPGTFGTFSHEIFWEK